MTLPVPLLLLTLVLGPILKKRGVVGQVCDLGGGAVVIAGVGPGL